MSLRWREARREDVPAVVSMLADDVLGQGRESADLGPYLAAFDAMQAEASNRLIVGEDDGRVLATYQLTVISGLSLTAARRAQIEGVRVASDRRGEGLGAALMADAEARARAAGCKLLQFTSNKTRDRAHAFYERLGFTPSHIGFKRPLE
ncbi:GNAT family N-acetyltransferase [Tropicimonas isoalkanivorans]|uniref:N-acetylglutamate synthase, GNAT family n=1 Tax=Tropicimonas isoalkanivorans TaxID=441112 RepID=A0A1I1JP34_9RHOB|nr:GNAT family N-acetyltransferase [Tropicimonas isoalkanivorans]SFC49951.1 N-acetylglutamate synthase, GNAT family [Tropicimonas isoalkanivorans]